VNVSPADGGDITSNKFTTNPVNYPASYSCSFTYTLLAVPNQVSGYQFDHWEGGISGSANPKTVTIESAMSVTAVFVLDPDDDGDGYTVGEGDCNDNDSTVFPGASEICGDGIDQDCNGSDEACMDPDNDGDGVTVGQGDCNDNDATIYPGAIEICGDAIDQDCNGSDLACTAGPSAPTGVDASDGTPSGLVRVTWNAASGAASYDIYRADMPAWTGTSPKRIASSTGMSYDDTTAVSGSRYYYWVKARNSGGVSKYSNFDPGYWGTPGSIPSVPANVDAEDGGSGMVTVTWTGSQDTLVYEVYRADLPAYLDFNLTKIATVTDASYKDMSAVEGNQYYYWIKARNSWGVSRYSTFDTGYVGAASTPPAAPLGVTATDGTVSGKVSITWLTSTGSMGYEIWRATKLVSAGGTPVRIGYVTGTSFDDMTATSGVTYYYWAKARDSWGSSKYSIPNTGEYN